MKFITKFKKVVSLIVTASLLISFVIQPQTVNAMTNEEATKQYKQIFKDFVLPYSYGQITKAHYAGTDRVIINIQDLHCHPKVQRNISNIIETFDKSYGVKKVYLEGAYGKVDTSWINKKIQEYSMPDLLDKMLETGRLTGAEYYSALSGKNQIISGLEEKRPYLENLKRFGTIVENQEKINMILNAMDESLASLKKKYYTKRQYKIEELSKNFSEGKISPQKYYSLLSKHIDKLGIDISKYENTFTYVMLLELQKKLDYSKITTELQTLLLLLKEQFPQAAYQMLLDNTDNFRKIDKLYSYIVQIARLYNLDLAVNFPNLDKYFGYIEFSQKINPLDLIVEEENLTREINTRFSETKAQREIVFLVNFRKYLSDYVTSKITSTDYDYYMENIDTYKQLWNKYVDNRVLSLLDDYMTEADKFYKINTDRNIYFTNNMFKESDVLNKIESETQAKGDVNKIIENMKSVKEVDVVITGGFHSQTVTEILKNHGVSYIVITPNVEDGVKLAEDTYYQIAKEQSKISFQALANLIASLSPVVQQKIFESIDVKEKAEQISTLSAEDKIKELREIISAKLLESDDEGKVLDKIVDIINENVETSVTEEFLDKIGVESFKNLLNGDIKDLKKVVETLQKPVLEQAITAISDSVDAVQEQISDLEQISQNDQVEQISNRTRDNNTRTRFVTGVKKAAACVILSLTLMFSPLNLFGTGNVQAAGSDIAPVKNESVKKKEEISFEYLKNTVDSKYVSQEEEDFNESVAFSEREDVLESIQELKTLLNKLGFSIDDDTRIIFMKGTDADLNTACAFPEIKTIAIPVDELSTDSIDSLINLLSGKITKDMDLESTLAFMQQIVHENTHVNNNGKDLSPLKDEELAIYNEITVVDKLIKAGVLDIKTLKRHDIVVSFPDMKLDTGELVNHVGAMKYIGIKGAVDNSEDIVNRFRNITGNSNISFYDMNYAATLYSDKNSLGFKGEDLVDSDLDLTEMEIVIALKGTRNGPVVRFVVDTNINVDEGPIKGSINKGTGNFILDTSDFRFIEESESESASVQQQSGQENVYAQMTTIPTKFILKILRIDEKTDKGQRVINLLENWQIMLGIFFPPVRKMFVNLHGKQNKKSIEEGLSFILNNSGSFVREAVQNVPTMNFAEKIKGFVVLSMRRYTREDVAEAHSNWNKLQLLKKQIKDNAVSKDLVLDLFHILNRFNVTDRNLIINTVFDFVDKEKSQTEKIKLLKVLSDNFTYLSKDQRSSVVNKVFELSDVLSLSDRMELLRNIIRNYEKFDFTNEQKKQFAEELKKIAGQKTKESKELFSLIINKANYFDNEQRKAVSDMAIEEGVDVSTLLFNFDYFDIDTKNKIFDLAAKTIKEQKQKGFNYILGYLIESMYKLNSEQKDIVFTEAINFINSDNNYNERLHVLNGMIKNIKYFNQSQQKEIYDIAGSFITKGKIKETKSLILSLLISLSADEFSKLDGDFRENVVNTVLKFKLEDFNNTKDINFNTDETFKLINGLLQKVDCLNSEQKNMLFDIVDKFVDSSKLKEQEKVDSLQMIFEQISVFPKEQQDKFKNMAKSFNLQFSSSVIGNNTYTPLISKIANIRDRIVNKYKFFNLNDLSQASKSDTESFFQSYKQLEEENLKTLKLLMNLSSKKDLEDLYRSLLNMYASFYSLSLSESASNMLELIETKFKPWLFENKDMDIEKEKGLHGYNIDTILSAKLEDVTINDLINVLHQTAINEFKNKMVNINFRRDSDSYIQNFSKNGYINPEIKDLLSKIVTLDGAMVCFDENTLVISITPIDRHSTTIIVNTDNINRGISFSFYDAILDRSTSVKSVLERMGFEAELKGTYVNAKLNKTNGLDESVDLTEKFDLLLRMFYLTTKYNDKQYFAEGLEKYTDDYMTAVDNGLEDNNILKFNNSIRQNDIFSTIENLNSVLKELGLPEISEDNNFTYEEPFSHTKVLGQTGINKYFNEVIDRAFSEGRIIVDKQGNIVKNKDYTEFKNIQNLLSDINVKEDEVLKQASVIDELNKQNGQILNLETKAKVGLLEYQTGYLQLSTGEYLFVKVLKNPVNGMIRYANSELVKQDGQRVSLSGKLLADKIIAEGYQVYDLPRQKTKIEKENIRKELNAQETKSANVSKSGNLLGRNNGSVTGKIVFSADKVDADSILLKEYLSPEDMEGTLNAKGIVLASAMELSHQGLIVKEKGILATIITGIDFTEREGKSVAEIKYTEYSGKNKKINGIEVEEVVEKTVTVFEGDEIAIDGDTGRVIIFDKDVVNGTSRDKSKLAEYKKYKDMEKSATKSAEETVVSEETEQESIQRPVISQNIEDNIKGFDETADKQNFGTKSTNLQDMSALIDEMSKILGVDVRVPYGVMIGAGAFLSILNKNEKFKELYAVYEQAIRNGNKTLANETARKITNIIENLSKDELKTFADLIDKKIENAIANGYVSENDKYAVRSAFKNEDGSKFSAAGVGESKVGVERNKITDALINIVLTSVYGDRSVAYQSSNRQEFIPAALVQQAVDSQKSAVMTVKDGHITISGSLGQGEIVVSGEKSQSVIQVNVDKNNKIEVADYVTQRQDYQYGLNGEVKPVSSEDSTKEIFSLTDIEQMSKIGLYLKEKYGYDADIELAMKDGVIYVVQIRPITEKTQGTKESESKEQLKGILKKVNAPLSDADIERISDKISEDTNKYFSVTDPTNSNVLKELFNGTINLPEEVLASLTRLFKLDGSFTEQDNLIIHNYVFPGNVRNKTREKQMKLFAVIYAYMSWKEKFGNDFETGKTIKVTKRNESEKDVNIEIKYSFDDWLHTCDGHSILMNGNEEYEDRYKDSTIAFNSAITLDMLTDSSSSNLIGNIINDWDLFSERKGDSNFYIKNVNGKIYALAVDMKENKIMTIYVIDGEQYKNEYVKVIRTSLADRTSEDDLAAAIRNGTLFFRTKVDKNNNIIGAENFDPKSAETKYCIGFENKQFKFSNSVFYDELYKFDFTARQKIMKIKEKQTSDVKFLTGSNETENKVLMIDQTSSGLAIIVAEKNRLDDKNNWHLFSFDEKNSISNIKQISDKELEITFLNNTKLVLNTEYVLDGLLYSDDGRVSVTDKCDINVAENVIKNLIETNSSLSSKDKSELRTYTDRLFEILKTGNIISMFQKNIINMINLYDKSNLETLINLAEASISEGNSFQAQISKRASDSVSEYIKIFAEMGIDISAKNNQASIQQENKVKETYYQTLMDLLKASINPVQMVIDTMKELLKTDKYMTGKNLIIDDDVSISDELRTAAMEKGINIVTLKIVTEQEAKIRGGKLIDEQNKIRMYFDSNKNELLVYSKQGINVSVDAVKEMISAAYKEGRQDLNFNGEQIVAFAKRTDTTIADIQNRIEIARKYGIIKADTEIKFDLTNDSISVNKCDGEYQSTGANTFIITQDQTESKDISALREKGYRFIVSCKADTISSIMLLDGIQVDAKDITSKQEAISLLEKLQKMCNVEKTISVEFNEDLYKQLKGIDILKEYGVLPVIKADAVGSVTGKKEVKDITNKTNIEQLLNNDEIVGVIADSQSRSIFSVIKDMLKIKTNVYDKGLNVGLREGHACDISKLKSVLINGEVKSDDVASLELQTEDEVYLKYLLENEKSEEALGFVIGLAMNNIKQQWKAKFTNIDDNLFAKEGKGQYEKGLLLLMLSMQMSGVDIKDLLDEVSVAQYDDRGWNLSAEEMYRIIGEKASVIITRVLNENDKKIKVLSDDEIAKSKEDFKDLNILIQDRFRVQESAQEVQISALAVKSILAAA